MLTQEELKANLYYSQNTGLFIWLRKNCNRVHVGDIAGCKKENGYIDISVNRNKDYAHRLAFLYMTGSLPAQEVDHINHIRDDNRWCNLRLATDLDNSRNKYRSAKNTSGCLGVYKKRNKWQAGIYINKKHIRLGLFSEKAKAIDARKKAERLYGFHENHGRN